MAWEGMPKEDALALWEEVEQDGRFCVTELRSHFNLEQQRRLWFLAITFEYRSNRRARLRIGGYIHTRERWEAFAKSCRDQAVAAMQGARAPSATAQRRMAGNSRKEAQA